MNGAQDAVLNSADKMTRSRADTEKKTVPIYIYDGNLSLHMIFFNQITQIVDVKC